MDRRSELPAIEAIPVDELGDSGPLLQTRFWARFKESFGWRASAYLLRGGGALDGTHLLALTRTLPGRFRLAYVPHGPDLASLAEAEAEAEIGAAAGDSTDPVAALPAIAAAIASSPGSPGESPRRSADLVRFDLTAPAGTAIPAPLRRSPVTVQPPDTVMIDIAAPDEAILAGMKPKTRYNVKLAERRGVTVREGSVEELSRWYELYRVTAERDRIAIHSFRYYSSLFETAVDHPEIGLFLLFAEVEGETVAGNIVGRSGGTGYYLYGASSNSHRNLMPTYLLQWDSMRRCRDLGCVRYDLWGIPPADDPAHPMHGLYRMKTGFGGRIVHSVGAWDYLVSPLRAAAYRAAERGRELYFKRLRRRYSSSRYEPSGGTKNCKAIVFGSSP